MGRQRARFLNGLATVFTEGSRKNLSGPADK